MRLSRWIDWFESRVSLMDKDEVLKCFDLLMTGLSGLSLSLPGAAARCSLPAAGRE